jgi:hypothetical protein
VVVVGDVVVVVVDDVVVGDVVVVVVDDVVVGDVVVGDVVVGDVVVVVVDDVVVEEESDNEPTCKLADVALLLIVVSRVDVWALATI